MRDIELIGFYMDIVSLLNRTHHAVFSWLENLVTHRKFNNLHSLRHWHLTHGPRPLLVFNLLLRWLLMKSQQCLQSGVFGVHSGHVVTLSRYSARCMSLEILPDQASLLLSSLANLCELRKLLLPGCWEHFVQHCWLERFRELFDKIIVLERQLKLAYKRALLLLRRVSEGAVKGTRRRVISLDDWWTDKMRLVFNEDWVLLLVSALLLTLFVVLTWLFNS